MAMVAINAQMADSAPFSSAALSGNEARRRNPHPHLCGTVESWHLREGLSVKSANFKVAERVDLPLIHFAPDVRVVLSLAGCSRLSVGGTEIGIGKEAAYDGVWLPVLKGECGGKHFKVQAQHHELVLFVGLDWWAACCNGWPAQPAWLTLPPTQHLQARYFQVSPHMRVLAAQIEAAETQRLPLPVRRLQQESAAVALLAEVAQQLVLQGGHVGGLPAAQQKRVSRLTALLHSGQADDWPLAQMAAHCHCNTTTLQRNFQEHHGVSIAHYLRRLKLARAYRALLAGARVNEAAAAAGYRHLESFSKAFKQQYHVCPRQVRSMA